MAIKFGPGTHYPFQQNDAVGSLDLIIALIDEPGHRLEHFLRGAAIWQHHVQEAAAFQFMLCVKGGEDLLAGAHLHYVSRL